MYKVAVIILNWNGKEDSLACLKALKKQTQAHDIIIVDNGSNDDFYEVVKKRYPDFVVLKNKTNLGFAGGVNTGIRHALKKDFDFIALINNDATPDKSWLKELLNASLGEDTGIVTGKLLKTDGSIDSTGDLYTSWGLAYPRGRNQKDNKQYNDLKTVFGATGGASLYRANMLKDIGLFDEDFFAYYEDVDLSFRAQLAGWKVIYTPEAIAYHKIGASSSKIPGFTTYMTIKNLPWLFLKNVPWRLMSTILPRFFIAYTAIIISSLLKGKFIPVAKGLFMTTLLLPKKLIQRHGIQSKKTVTTNYLRSIITYDLPPNAKKLIVLRSVLRKLRFWV